MQEKYPFLIRTQQNNTTKTSLQRSLFDYLNTEDIMFNINSKDSYQSAKLKLLNNISKAIFDYNLVSISQNIFAFIPEKLLYYKHTLNQRMRNNYNLVFRDKLINKTNIYKNNVFCDFECNTNISALNKQQKEILFNHNCD